MLTPSPIYVPLPACRNSKNWKRLDKKRILNGFGWTLLFAASLAAVGVFPGLQKDRFAILLTLLSAMASVPLLWLGGHNSLRCNSAMENDE